MLVIVLGFYSMLGIWALLEIDCLDSYLGWLSVSFWMLEMGLELTFTIEYLILMPLRWWSKLEMDMEVTQLTSVLLR